MTTDDNKQDAGAIPGLEPSVLKKFQESMKQLPEATTTAQRYLCQRGWFLSADWPVNLVFLMSKYCRDKDDKQIDEAMSSYIEMHCRDIEEHLTKSYPKRAGILAAAFNAHVYRNYELCVPVFLIQADGICQEKLGVKLYSKKDGKRITANQVGAYDAQDTMSALMEALRLSTPLLENENDTKDDTLALNRHRILHGISLSYATRLNSLRSISLLDFVGSSLSWREFFREMKEKRKT